ncbi:MAG TPA: hypothetical protein VLZ12_01320 [Verrucomicrobiae bacterium]|nr:hypothetical protein [Verrucomicrobiae bacterium]
MNLSDRFVAAPSWLLAAVVTTAATGCASHNAQSTATTGRARDVTQVAPAQFGPAPAKIRSVDSQYKFVVIDFTSRVMPPIGTELAVYRKGKRVGVVRITEPARAQFATADVLEGDPWVGDEAR